MLSRLRRRRGKRMGWSCCPRGGRSGVGAREASTLNVPLWKCIMTSVWLFCFFISLKMCMQDPSPPSTICFSFGPCIIQDPCWKRSLKAVLKKKKKQSWISRASQVAQALKNLPANAGDVRDSGLTPGWEDHLEKGMATHPSILTWRIPWTEEPGGLQSLGSWRVGHDWATAAFTVTWISRILYQVVWCQFVFGTAPMSFPSLSGTDSGAVIYVKSSFVNSSDVVSISSWKSPRSMSWDPSQPRFPRLFYCICNLFPDFLDWLYCKFSEVMHDIWNSFLQQEFIVSGLMTFMAFSTRNGIFSGVIFQTFILFSL